MLVYSDGDPTLYDDYYTRLRDFIDKSFDTHKVSNIYWSQTSMLEVSIIEVNFSHIYGWFLHLQCYLIVVTDMKLFVLGNLHND